MDRRQPALYVAGSFTRLKGFARMRAFAKAALISAVLFAPPVLAPPVLAQDQVLDLSKLTCKDYTESGKEGIQMIGTWLDGYYFGKGTTPVIQIARLIKNMQGLAQACAGHGDSPLLQTADTVYK